MSYFASKYVRFITGLPIHDTTAGFVCYRRTVLETIQLDNIKFIGYLTRDTISIEPDNNTVTFDAEGPLGILERTPALTQLMIDDSTPADWVGAVTVSLAPLVARIEDHVRAAERIHVDDTPVPVLAKGKTRTGHLWTVVRDDRPFAGPAAPAAAYLYSATRSGEHIESWLPAYSGLMQTDAFAGYNRLYDPGRKPGPITEAGCWAHARRKFFELADLRKAPLAAATVKAIDAIFAVERDIAGKPPDERAAIRQERSRPLVNALEAQLRADLARLSSKGDPAKAINYMLKRWPAFVRFLDDGRLCLSNNAAERAVRGIAVGRKNWIFAGSDAGARRAAAMYTLIETAKLNDIDPRAWIADVLDRLPAYPVQAIDDLLPWNWKSGRPDPVSA
jgi:transposase